MLNKKLLLFAVSAIYLLIFACSQSMNNPLLANDTMDISDDIDCIFDTSSYKFTTEALLKFDKSLPYKWDNNLKQAKAVLRNGDTLYLSIGGCDHFGYTAILITKMPFNETDSLLDKARWLARSFFENGFESYDQLIEDGKFNKSEESTSLYSIYDVIQPDSIAENCVFDGFSFEKRKNNTKIEISAYIN